MSDQTDSRKPPYNVTRDLGGPNWIRPPFQFQGVTMRVFPLRANLQTLQHFVDGYLNRVFPNYEAGWFRAFVPYVYLMVVNYGKMSLDAVNMGWISQREILFNIPLEWYRKEGDQLVFHDWAQVAPFIYVDNELSMALGRQVQGWPKKLAHLERQTSSWMDSPSASALVASVSTQVFPQPYSGKTPEQRPFLEVFHNPNSTEWPVDWKSPLMPWMMASHLAQTGGALAEDAFETLRGMWPGLQQDGALPRSSANMAQTLMGMLNPLAPNLYFNCVNLKQFRDAELPNRACYQAIVNSPMTVRSFNSGGLLGPGEQSSVEASGGYSIQLTRYPSLPIVETLGLEVENQVTVAGTTVCTLRPIFPYWMDVDMTYGVAEVAAERTATSMMTPSKNATTGPVDERSLLIRTTDGTVAQEVTGAFNYPNSTLRVLPLLAERAKLQEFCDGLLNSPLADVAGRKVRFAPWGDYVYVVIANHEQIASEANTLGVVSDRELTCYLPVLMYVTEEGGERLRTSALIPMISFLDDGLAANSAIEVDGIPTVKATLDSPPTTWMDEAGPSESAYRRVLGLSTLLFPSLGLGQPAETRLLLEVIHEQVPASGAASKQRAVDDHWGSTLLEELQKRSAHSDKLPLVSALALEPLTNGLPFNILTLKQIRDATDSERACYQSLTAYEHRFTRIHDLRELEGFYQLRVQRFASAPLVEKLGLVRKSVEYEGSSIIDVMEPVRPFWMKVSMHRSRGKTLFLCTESGQWKPIHETEKGCFQGASAREADIVSLMEALLPRNLAEQFHDWKAKRGLKGPLSIPGVAELVETIPPQWIIEHMLSHEWEHWGNPRWQMSQERFERRARKKTREELGESSRFFHYMDQTLQSCFNDPLRKRTQELYDKLILKKQPEDSTMNLPALFHLLGLCSRKPTICLHRKSLPKRVLKDAWLWEHEWYTPFRLSRIR
jgi:hypothetical protein